MGSADWLRMYAQRMEDEHAPSNLSIGMREVADQMDQQRETVLQILGQVGQLSDELERTKREAERAQDAYGVRFLNYLEETARLTDEIEKLRAALRDCLGWHDYSNDMHKPIEVRAAYMRARAALEGK